ncbi:uncharacterized protein LOC122655456 [Telopea speciosissima]|uniref:uncharacterized protein LOC122655456 n=1 Tax=Telopea speciosissima TaxID=54955 RepID=UPI001CC79491|nr:uncharacterized protein LOC122655456 [Telopea speciosissima]
MEQRQPQVDALQAKLTEVKAFVDSKEDAKKELEVLWRRIKTTSMLLTYLKSKARIMSIPRLAHTSCGIRHQEGVGLVDKNDIMEALVKRVIMAETETAIQKEKVTLGQEEIKKKALQIESMSVKVEEMERFALMEALVKRVLFFFFPLVSSSSFSPLEI